MKLFESAGITSGKRIKFLLKEISTSRSDRYYMIIFVDNYPLWSVIGWQVIASVISLVGSEKDLSASLLIYT